MLPRELKGSTVSTRELCRVFGVGGVELFLKSTIISSSSRALLPLWLWVSGFQSQCTRPLDSQSPTPRWTHLAKIVQWVCHLLTWEVWQTGDFILFGTVMIVVFLKQAAPRHVSSLVSEHVLCMLETVQRKTPQFACGIFCLFFCTMRGQESASWFKWLKQTNKSRYSRQLVFLVNRFKWWFLCYPKKNTGPMLVTSLELARIHHCWLL